MEEAPPFWSMEREMLLASAREAIEGSDDKAELALVLSWDASVRPEMLAGVTSRARRMEIVDRFFQEAKRPVLEHLQRTPGVKLVNSLDGMANAIVTAKAGIWKKLAESRESPLHRTDVKILPNVVVGGLP